MTEIFAWRGIKISFNCTVNWLNTGYTHLEIRADEPLPITQTGYRSAFFVPADLEPFESASGYVLAWLDTDAESQTWQSYLEDQRQLKLF